MTEDPKHRLVMEYIRNEQQQHGKDKAMTDDKQNPMEAALDQVAKVQEMTRPPMRSSISYGTIPSLGASGDPKGEAGASKPGLGNISVVAQYYEGAVMAQGAKSYGAYNWCEHPMKASTYYNAILRHLNAWWLGEDIDPKSMFPHMAHIRASSGIIIDQQETRRMIDDRPKTLADIHKAWDKITAVEEYQEQLEAKVEEVVKGVNQLLSKGD